VKREGLLIIHSFFLFTMSKERKNIFPLAYMLLSFVYAAGFDYCGQGSDGGGDHFSNFMPQQQEKRDSGFLAAFRVISSPSLAICKEERYPAACAVGLTPPATLTTPPYPPNNQANPAERDRERETKLVCGLVSILIYNNN
jgi:hypothetical protein